MDDGALLVIEEQERVKKTVKFIETGETTCEKCYFHDHGHCPWDCDYGYYVEHNPSHWHTGKPTEDGEYLVICQYVIDNHYYQEKLVWEFENGDWKNKQRLTESHCIKDLKIIAWYGQKIEPYKEGN